MKVRLVIYPNERKCLVEGETHPDVKPVCWPHEISRDRILVTLSLA